MNYRRRHNRRDRRESSFFRNWKFEAPKEALGKLAELGGVMLGTLAAEAAARKGIPVQPTHGAIVGWMIGAAGKTAVVASLDGLKNRAKPASDNSGEAAATGDGEATDRPPLRAPRPAAGRPWRRGPQLGRRDAGRPTGLGGGVSVGGVIAEVERIIRMIEHGHQGLTGSMEQIGRDHAWLTTVLAGAHPAVRVRIEGQLTGARRAIEETCALLRLANDNLRGYLRTI